LPARKESFVCRTQHNSVLIQACSFGSHWQCGPRHPPIMGFRLDSSMADCNETPEAGFHVQMMHGMGFQLALLLHCIESNPSSSQHKCRQRLTNDRSQDHRNLPAAILTREAERRAPCVPSGSVIHVNLACAVQQLHCLRCYCCCKFGKPRIGKWKWNLSPVDQTTADCAMPHARSNYLPIACCFRRKAFWPFLLALSF